MVKTISIDDAFALYDEEPSEITTKPIDNPAEVYADEQ